MNPWTWGQDLTRRIPAGEIPGAVVELVVRRQGGRFCVDCRALGIATPPDVPLELDHRQPLAKGGNYHHLNLEFRCRSHNRGRADRDLPGQRPKRPAWERRRR